MSIHSFSLSSSQTLSEVTTPYSSPISQHTAATVLTGDKQSSIQEWNQDVDKYRGCRLMSTIEEEEPPSVPLNPTAPSFQPRRAPPSRPSNPKPGQSSTLPAPPGLQRHIIPYPAMEPHAPWTTHLISGTRRETPDRRTMARDAAALVANPSFNAQRDHRIVAQRLCERAAYLKFQGGPDSLAPFIYELHNTIHRILGRQAGEEFRVSLSDIFTATFIHLWDEQTGCKNMEYAIAGVSVGNIVGDLHALGLIDGPSVSECLFILLGQLRNGPMEYLQAIHAILMNVNMSYWGADRHLIDDFLAVFLPAAETVDERCTIGNGDGYPRSVKTVWVEEVKDRILRFGP